ncbi:4-hydroxy-tetrahydrodipicolinate synthase [Eisenibacter elegans]|jgi:4-hydroxy-tetrahydrodipicolinate synthase|uniref:4-hydroxy-tetrahydrodipicolinate synthase n=1 Tax=Eisenibacter elegans TaxID=997 RepID=UPI000414486B|nr:4-hydroxy-tetrahydrodipicolinate synthase [Eisenibacter elegans]
MTSQTLNLRGTGVALITPFTAEQTVDYPALARVLSHTGQAEGVEYWVVNGTTAESPTTSAQEKAEILAFVKANNPQRLPIIYGIGGNHTQAVIEQIRKTDLHGVSAIMSVSPYYNKPSQQGIIAHYRAIADASPLPVIMYNVPGRTGSNMSAATILTLAEHPNIIAVKDASANIEQYLQIAKNKPKDFYLISGDDMHATALIAIGGEGVISVLANAFPTIFSKAIRAALAQDFGTANELLYQLIDINGYMYEESNPVGLKALMAQLDLCRPTVRLPLVEASEALHQKIKATMPKA